MTGLDWSHRIDEISKEGRDHQRQATQGERATLIKTLNLLSCECFTADYTLKAAPSDRVVLNGQLRAKGTQACVVSLEPVSFQIDEAVMVTFVPESAVVNDDPEVEYEALSVDDLEPHAGNAINVGRVFFDHFSAGLDPYPRAPGAAFDDVVQPLADDGHTTHPFGALEKLKHKP